jgi:hypothetical protein
MDLYGRGNSMARKYAETGKDIAGSEDGHKQSVLHLATKLMRSLQDEHSKEGQWMLEGFGVVFMLHTVAI